MLISRIYTFGIHHCKHNFKTLSKSNYRLFCNTVGNSLVDQIKAVGDEIRNLKVAKAEKDEIKKRVEELLSLKQQFEQENGAPYDPPSSSSKKSKSKDTTDKGQIDQRIEPIIDIIHKNYYDIDENDGIIEFGDYDVMKSDKELSRKFVDIRSLEMGEDATSTSPKEGEEIWLRGRVSSVRAKGNACFLVIRAASGNGGGLFTVQAVHFKSKDDAENSKKLIKYVSNIALESIVDIRGTVAAANVKSCTQSNVEIQINKLFIVSRSPIFLPFLLEDASRPDAIINESQNTDRPFAKVAQDIRLNNRWLDLRVPANNAIMRIRSGVSTLFRMSLLDEGFIEIQTPKLISGESEGGSEVFRTDYFGQPACLAQSPQLYKQMAISSDLNRVFEVGPVFRAENSNTRRHLCEFTGLDMEMAINEHYNEALGVLHRMFRAIFNGLEERFPKELECIRQQYPSEPVLFTDEPLIIHWNEGMQMLIDAGHDDIDVFGDLSTSLELQLGELVKKKYNTDFYILDRYPSVIRPFYTMPCPDDNRYSNSYDIFIRGQEICSGAQRCHDVELLKNQMIERNVDPKLLHFYIDSFRHGVSPHAGAGIGLDRVVFLYLGLDNVRKSSMFPRDPGRCVP